jgi:hypothetical protein
VTPINIAIPESLTEQKAELEATLAGIAEQETKLAVQRKEIQVALNAIATGIAILSGQPLPVTKPVATSVTTTRKPMSAEAKQRIAEGLRKSAQAKAMAKAAQAAVPAPKDSAPAPADAPMVVSAPQEPSEAPVDAPVPVTTGEPSTPAPQPADAPVADTRRESRASRKPRKA